MNPEDQWGYNNQWDQPAASPNQNPGNSAGISPTPPGAPSGTWTPEEPQKSSKKPTILIATVAVLALALLGGGGWYLTTRDSPEQTAAAKESTRDQPATSPSAKTKPEKDEQQTSVQETAVPPKGSCEQATADADMNRPVSSFCDGQWALVGDYGTDHTELYYWTGDSWGTYEHDGRHSSGSRGRCYERGNLIEAEAPPQLVNKMYAGHLLCNDTPASPGDSSSSQQNNALPSDDGPPGGDWLPYPPCDGSYALIVDSVVVYPGQDPKPLVRKSLAAHPGAEATYPDQCAAFRSRVDGAYVYPVYIKYGNDLAGVCAAQNRGEGNARKLQRVADYSSPC